MFYLIAYLIGIGMTWSFATKDVDLRQRDETPFMLTAIFWPIAIPIFLGMGVVYLYDKADKKWRATK